MISNNRKRLPYDNSNFEKIRMEGYVYVDKMRFIELLEQEDNNKLFFVRPRKFGKSLFLSMLTHYYDVCRADKFDILFGDLYIGKHPTPKHNELMVINFNFSGIDTTSQEGFALTFTANIRESVRDFIIDHKNILPDYTALNDKLDSLTAIADITGLAFYTAKSKQRKVFAIIDEYGHFANDFIALGTAEGVAFYKQNIRANGIVRDFYETLKDKSKDVIDRIMLTGITPIMLDDLTSGFNVATNLSLDPFISFLNCVEQITTRNAL
jgi:hypothetical protein